MTQAEKNGNIIMYIDGVFNQLIKLRSNSKYIYI